MGDRDRLPFRWHWVSHIFPNGYPINIRVIKHNGYHTIVDTNGYGYTIDIILSHMNSTNYRDITKPAKP